MQTQYGNKLDKITWNPTFTFRGCTSHKKKNSVIRKLLIKHAIYDKGQFMYTIFFKVRGQNFNFIQNICTKITGEYGNGFHACRPLQELYWKIKMPIHIVIRISLLLYLVSTLPTFYTVFEFLHFKVSYM